MFLKCVSGLVFPYIGELPKVTNKQVVRDYAHVYREYDMEKYSTMYATMRKQFFESIKNVPAKVVVSMDNQLWISQCPLTILNLFTEFIRTYLRQFESVCELGCGFGANIHGVPNAYGGDLSPNGIVLAKSFGIDASIFDFYNQLDYSFIKPNSTVFTCAAVEQLPSAKTFLNNLRSVKHNISRVVQIEPLAVYDYQKEYAKVNDYNTDLLTLLLTSEDVQIKKFHFDLFGFRPQNSLSLIEWTFK